MRTSDSNKMLVTLEDVVLSKVPFLKTPIAKHWRFRVLGLDVPPEAPVLWLATHVAYYDQFLHIVVYAQGGAEGRGRQGG